MRTSPDHGTAFGLAGEGVASAKSMCEAIRLAVRLADRKIHGRESSTDESNGSMCFA